MSVGGGVGSRVRRGLRPVSGRRHALCRRLTRVGRDALVAVVLGWTAGFAVAVSLPVLAMKVAVAVYERVGG